MKKGFPAAFLAVSGVVYLILATSLLSTVFTLPLAVVAFATDLTRTWVLSIALTPLAAAAVYASFAAFRAHAGGETSVVRPWLRAWAAAWRRAGWWAALTAVALLVLVSDVLFAVGKSFGLALVLVAAVAGVVGLLTWLNGLAALEEFPRLKPLAAAKASLYCSVRGAGWSLITLAAAGLYLYFLAVRPVLALLAATGPVLYLIWANSRRSLAPLRAELDPANAAPAKPAAPAASAARPAVKRVERPRREERAAFVSSREALG
jgi:hypothetical protein